SNTRNRYLPSWQWPICRSDRGTHRSDYVHSLPTANFCQRLNKTTNRGGQRQVVGNRGLASKHALLVSFFPFCRPVFSFNDPNGTGLATHHNRLGLDPVGEISSTP